MTRAGVSASDLVASYTCTITKPLGDRDVIVATCDGYAGRDETKWKSAPWNTIVKMADKRALIGAALKATATSGLLTQDVEDGRDNAAPRDLTADLREIVQREAVARTPDGQARFRSWLNDRRVRELAFNDLAAALVELGRISTDDRKGEPDDSTDVEAMTASVGTHAAVAGEGEPPASPRPEPLTSPQRAMIMAHLSKLERDERLARIGEIIGRPVESTNSLSKHEASIVIDRLEGVAS